jgi:hypothetical protein
MAKPNSPIPKRNLTRSVTGGAGGWLALGNEAALKRLKPLKSIQDQYIGSMMISIY